MPSSPIITDRNKFGSKDIGYFDNYQEATNAANLFSNSERVRRSEGSYTDSDQVKLHSPTVLTDANIREKTIPDLKNKLSNYNLTSSPSNRYSKDPTNINEDTPEDPYKLKSTEDIYSDAKTTASDQVEKDPIYKQEMDLLDKMQKTSDLQSENEITRIKDQYQQKESRLKESQLSSTRTLQNALINSGTSRYAPGNAATITDAKTRSDLSALSDIQSTEASLLSSANKAQLDGNFQNMQSKLELLDKKRDEKVKLAKEIGDRLSKENQDANKKTEQASRDSAVADLVSKGYTDPKVLLNLLNFDEQGNPTGDFSAEEIKKTLKNIAKDNGLDGDLGKLTGNTRDFFILKGEDSLPSAITSLPEEDQLAAWLKYTKSTTKGTTSGDTIADKNNNPGNLKDPTTGLFRVFTTPEEGFAAMRQDLLGKMTGKTSTGLNADSTLLDLAKVWAPKGDGDNDPVNYANELARQLGVSANTKIGTLKDDVDQLAQAIATNEGYGKKKGSVNKITLAEAKSNGFPLSLVGMSEEEVAKSFDEETPPQWFVEKARKEHGYPLTSSGVQSFWDDYRDQYLQKESGDGDNTASESKDYTKNATKYFKDTYGDQVSDDDITALVNAVQHYIDGGQTYAAAVKQVEKDASEQ